MSNKVGKRLLPALRFPEFRDAPAWKSKTVKELCDLKAGQFVSGADINEKPEQNLHPCYGGNGLRGYTRTFTHEGIYPLIGRQGALCGNVRQAIGRFHATEHAVVVSPKQETNVDWLFHLLVTLNLNRFATGQAQPGLSVEVIEKVPSAAPLPMEQRKIAACLSSLDDLIAAQAKKIEALKAHKKGLMQQLFPVEGETLPKLRFPEFRDAGEWDKKQIGDLKPFVTSGSRGWAAYYANQGSLFVRITNLTRESIYLDLTDTKFVKLLQEASEGVRTQLKEFDVLISITADIGIIGYVDASVPSPAYINQHIALVRFDASQVCSKFVSYFLVSERSQRLFRASTDNGTKAGMSLIVVQKIQVVLPSISEQQKIADCLATLDDLITAQTQKLTALKTHKKGLMQQLFPSVGGVPEGQGGFPSVGGVAGEA
ncbi:MAG: hypothetical protein B7Y40_02625 [Gammaproteobacteria bacterium 28-57-27]|nr:MAG: hypothetical protein B7Y40_02625 [Gammaproteobacteria bacterium 28-57-27]